MIGCGARSGALPLAEARSGKALLQVLLTRCEVYLRGACGEPGPGLGAGLPHCFPSSPRLWGEGEGDGGKGTGVRGAQHLRTLGIMGQTEGRGRAAPRNPEATGIKRAARHQHRMPAGGQLWTGPRVGAGWGWDTDRWICCIIAFLTFLSTTNTSRCVTDTR